MDLFGSASENRDTKKKKDPKKKKDSLDLPFQSPMLRKTRKRETEIGTRGNVESRNDNIPEPWEDSAEFQANFSEPVDKKRG